MGSEWTGEGSEWTGPGSGVEVGCGLGAGAGLGVGAGWGAGSDVTGETSDEASAVWPSTCGAGLAGATESLGVCSETVDG